VQYIGHTANQLFAVCLHENTRETKNTRQTAMFAVCEDRAHGKHQVSPCAATLAHGETRARAMRVLVRRRPRPDGRVSNGREGNEHMQKRRRRRRNYAIKCYYICFLKKIALELHITVNLNLKDRSNKHKPNNKTYYTESRSQFSQT